MNCVLTVEPVKFKKFTSDEKPSYVDHEKAKVHIPHAVRHKNNPAMVKQIEQECLTEYKASKLALNESLADVATHDPKALEFAGELSKRVLTVIEVAVELGLVADNVDIDEQGLIKAGVPQAAIEARGTGLLGELKQNALKTKIISETGGSKGVEEGNRSEAGFVGFSPLAIQNATQGNLRERMYIPFKSTHGLLNKLLASPENVAKINDRLSEKGIDWRLNEPKIEMLSQQTANSPAGIFTYGAYATSRDGSRVNNSETARKEYANSNPTLTEMQSARMPLTERELLAQSGDLTKNAQQRVQWLPGEAWSRVIDSREHPTIKAADETADPVLTGISGTTDTMLTLGHMIGLFDGEDNESKLRDGMVACMGWMVDAKDHTAHEIQTSCKTFGLPYTPGPDSYKQIRPGDQEFLNQLEVAQEKRGFKTPEHYLSVDHVLEVTEKNHAKNTDNSPPTATQKQFKDQVAQLRQEESLTIENAEDINNLPTLNK